MATEVGVRELKSGMSDFIRRVEDGEVVTVTKRGKAVARIVPADIPLELAQLVQEGHLRLGSGDRYLPRPVRLKGSGKTAAEYVSEGRR